MTAYPQDDLCAEAADCFKRMVQSVGVQVFADSMHLSTRQINRMIAGAQPNPVVRIILALQSCQPDVGDEAMSFLCQEAGGFFIKDDCDLDSAAVSAVRECAEAIAAISDGNISKLDEREVRDAICALTALLRTVQAQRREHPDQSVKITGAAHLDGKIAAREA